MIHIRLSDKTHHAIKVDAALSGKSMNQLIGEIITDYLEKKGSKSQ